MLDKLGQRRWLYILDSLMQMAASECSLGFHTADGAVRKQSGDEDLETHDGGWIDYPVLGLGIRWQAVAAIIYHGL